MAYQPIQDYAIVGNMRTCALVNMYGSVDWLCYPHFDSPTVFARLLDDEKGGHFTIRPCHDDVTFKQLYWPDTNVLVSRFLTPDGVAEIEDFMPVGKAVGAGSRDRLVRRLRVVRGTLDFTVTCEPAFDYARATHQTHLSGYGARFVTDDLELRLACAVDLEKTDRGVTGTFSLQAGEEALFTLQHPEDGVSDACPDPKESQRLFEQTVEYWRTWLRQCRYTGRWREMVHRSALTLKLLTFEPTGAIVAAPTCGLPEEIGGGRNWDYRYTWIRDAAFTLYGFMRLGFTAEAEAFMGWLDARYHEPHSNGDAPLQIVYSIHGDHELVEHELPHLDGYRGSKPVRIGNGAHDQFQLDIYGELMDSVYLYNKYGTPISYEAWIHLRRLLDWVCDNWQRQDMGIWEVRSGKEDFTYSKLMCWVALDRGLRLAEKRSFPADQTRWRKTRNEIYDAIMEKGWNEERGSFVQHFGSDELDASTLIMPMVFFLSPGDPRLLRMLDTINRPPGEGGLVSDSLVYRYDTEASEDGLGGGEGTFNMCTFWLAEALTRAGAHDPQRLDQGRLLFEKMLGYANHVGLYAEETGPSGEALGNFPQAFTHLAVISCAYNLDRTLDGG